MVLLLPATSLRSRRKCKELLQFLDMHFVIGVKVVPKRQGLAQKSRYNIITTWQGTAETSDSLSLSLLSIYCFELHLQIFPTVDPLRHQTRASLQRRLFFCCLKSHKRNSIKGLPPPPPNVHDFHPWLAFAKSHWPSLIRGEWFHWGNLNYSIFKFPRWCALCGDKHLSVKHSHAR